MQLLTNLAGDGSSADYTHLGYKQMGNLHVYVSGNLGGGTLDVEAKLPDGSGYVLLQSITAIGLNIIESGPMVIRLTLSGSTTPDLSAWVESDSVSGRASVEGR